MKYLGAALILQLVLFSQVAFAQDSVSIVMDIGKDAVAGGSGLGIERPSSYIQDLGSDEKLFSLSLTAPSQMDLKISVVLPEDAKVMDKNGLLVSRPVSISTDGRKIFLDWSKPLSEGEEYTVFVQYRTNGPSSSVFPLLIAVVLVAGLAIGYSLKKFEKERAINQILSDDERKVVNEVKKRGQILQDEIRDSTGWSKTKISKIMRNLEMKDIITKTPYKKTNKIKLK